MAMCVGKHSSYIKLKYIVIKPWLMVRGRGVWMRWLLLTTGKVMQALRGDSWRRVPESKASPCPISKQELALLAAPLIHHKFERSW